MKTKVQNPNIAAQIIEILKEKGVEAKVESGHVVVNQNVQTALNIFPFRDWFTVPHEDCDCSMCRPG